MYLNKYGGTGKHVLKSLLQNSTICPRYLFSKEKTKFLSSVYFLIAPVMGRCRSRRRNRHKADSGTVNDRDAKDTGENRPRTDYKLAVRDNALFTKYYQNQGLVPEGEWEQFYSILKENLPVTFRITGCRSQGREMLKIVKAKYFKNLLDVEIEGKPVAPPSCLQWYPDELAWQLNFTRKEIRSSPALQKLHQFLITETESGNTNRQEAVSMIPPVLLDIQPHHKVLDMCAAPGSKTAQLIEHLHSDETKPVPEGFVVANDVDNKRCYMMVHQVKRLQSPCCMVINHDATILPNLRLNPDDNKREFVEYDRVLVDVPCSGDGTLRKNPDVWRTWNPAQASSLHGLQSRILKRGLELLAVGGRLIYSTCSFNPLENEAVIVAMLQRCEGSVELVDVSSQVPGLKFVPGLKTWKCMNKKGEIFERFEEVPEKFQTQLRPSMFPPDGVTADNLQLTRCIRILPHHQDTGGFFVAVMKKKKNLPWVRSVSAIIPSRLGTSRGLSKAFYNLVESIPLQVESQWPEEGCAAVSAEEILLTDQENSSQNTAEIVQSGISEKMETLSSTTKNTSGALLSTLNETLSMPLAVGEEADADVAEYKEKDDYENQSVSATAGKTPEENNSVSEKRKLVEDQRNVIQTQKRLKMQGYKEDPFFFLTDDDPMMPPIRKFYGISESFPQNQLMFRNECGKRRTLYFVSEAIKTLVLSNQGRTKFINMGVKILSRSPSPIVPECDFRIAQEGLGCLYHFFEGRRVPLMQSDIISLLSKDCLHISKLTERAQELIDRLGPGSILFHFHPSQSDPEPDCNIIFCGWRGKTTVRSFVGKHEREHYLRLCGQELSDIEKQMDKDSSPSDDKDGEDDAIKT